MRHTGIHIIGDVSWGTHFCQFYQDKQDLIDILVPYFKAGLENNEFCMWVTSEPLRAQEAQDALAKEIPNLGDYLRKGQIEILDYSQWYTAGGGFESDRVLRGWVGKLEVALKRGFDGLRLTGNTFWLEKADWQDFTEYEATVDGVIGRYRMVAICTYSLAKCGAAEIMDVVANHAFALIKRAGQWQVIENAERKRIEASLRASEERYSSLFEQMTEGFALHEIICDENGVPCDYRFLEINPAFERLTGLKRADVVGKTMRQVLPNDDPRWIEIYGRVALTGEAASLDNYSPELNRHYNVLAYRPVPLQFAVLFTDITDRKQAERALRESEAKQAVAGALDAERYRLNETASRYARSLIEASLDPLVTISPEGDITDVNQATELVTGVPREQMIATKFSEYFTEPQKAREGYHKVLSDGLVRDYPLTIRHASGRPTDVLYNATVYRNEAGDVLGVFAAARDVTERKRAEAELVRYRDHLEELVQQRTSELATANAHLQRTTAELVRSNQELEQFAYVASHDLQEPLRAVTGYLGLIEQQFGDKLDGISRRYIAGSVQGATRMHTLITDLLALSRLGTRSQAFESADLHTVLDRALDILGASIQEAGTRITCDPLPKLRVDAGQIAQLFQNLIGNALKFRGERPPEIHISAQQQPDRWVLSVRDNGIGIEPQYFERIFLIFQRLHTRKQYPGNGIGLAICKKIVERHGGSIWVESQGGQGSIFYFAMPKREVL